jgi:hypothetical protein
VQLCILTKISCICGHQQRAQHQRNLHQQTASFVSAWVILSTRSVSRLDQPTKYYPMKTMFGILRLKRTSESERLPVDGHCPKQLVILLAKLPPSSCSDNPSPT